MFYTKNKYISIEASNKCSQNGSASSRILSLLLAVKISDGGSAKFQFSAVHHLEFLARSVPGLTMYGKILQLCSRLCVVTDLCANSHGDVVPREK